MNKLRNAIEEGKFAARIARQFFRAYRKWRDANPDEDVVYVYVGHPDMGAAIAQQSPLWQRFAAWEQEQDMTAMPMSLFSRDESKPSKWDSLTHAEKEARYDAAHKLLDKRATTLPRIAQCDCAACTASRATREESKAYDA